jgi:hypothetical protein
MTQLSQIEDAMSRALKLHVHVGKDHVVKLPSDFPEGLAEIIVTPVEASPAGVGGLSLWSTVADKEYDSFHEAVQRLRATDSLRRNDE